MALPAPLRVSASRAAPAAPPLAAAPLPPPPAARHPQAATAASDDPDILSQLRLAMAALDASPSPPRLSGAVGEGDAGSSSSSSVSGDVFEHVGGVPAGTGLPPLQQVAHDIAALASRNAALQREIDGISVASSSGGGVAAVVAALGTGQQQQHHERHPAGSLTMLPPTPDISQA